MKKVVIAIIAIVLSLVCVSCSSGSKGYEMGAVHEVQNFKYNDKEHKCSLCGDGLPTCMFYNPNDTDEENRVYVCEECAHKCFFCGKEPKYYYQNGFGVVNFICEDDYDSEMLGEVQ